MKRLLLALTLILFCGTMKAQVASIVPNSGFQGQSLSTTITCANGVMSMSSAPFNLNDIYLEKNGTYIFASNYYVYPGFPQNSDSLQATFDIPSNAVLGLWNVHVITHQCGGCPTPTNIDNLLTNGFTVDSVEGYIEGDVYYDANQNGTNDAGDVGLSYQRLNLLPSNMFGFTDLTGHYRIPVNSGTYTVGVVASTAFTQTSVPATYTVTLPPDTAGNDFGLYSPPGNDFSQAFFIYTPSRFRCNGTSYVTWNAHNTSASVETGVVTMTYTPALSFISSSLSPYTQGTNSVRWNYQISPFQTLVAGVTFQNPPAGTYVGVIIVDSIFDVSGNFKKTYTYNYSAVTTCAMDPNDKSVLPQGEDSQHYTLKNSDLDYTIRFQNTGNDTAFNVMILDTLDSHLDVSTFSILGSSHPVNPVIDGNGIVQFRFDNIRLPDSVIDEPNSHGWVVYRISPLSNIADGSVIGNTAHIFFDSNADVITNTTFNTMVTQIPTGMDKIASSSASFVYPNPVTNQSTLVIPQNSSFEMLIYDVTGREVESKNISENYVLTKNKFVPGIYYYQLRDKSGKISSNGKFIIAE